MYPKTIAEIIEGLEKSTLSEGLHIEFKNYHSSVKVDDLTRCMIGLANSGGGVIVLGASTLSFPGAKIKGAQMIDGMPKDTRNVVSKFLPDYIKLRVKNLDSWRIEYGKYLGIVLAAIFVNPSVHGMSYIYSESDKANRTYYYRRGSDVRYIRNQFKRMQIAPFKYSDYFERYGFTVYAMEGAVSADQWTVTVFP